MVTIKNLNGFDLTTDLIQISSEDGETGTPGNDGMQGKNGKTGCSAIDHGCVNYVSWWIPSSRFQHGKNLDVKYFKENGSGRIWCPHKDITPKLFHNLQ
jgi:hypothetical protein